MNLLAHAYLSFAQPEILVGNMISDFVKGRKKFDYSEGIQIGITVHRMIDTFTDEHEVTREAKGFLKSAVGLYSGAFVDVIYDHFLANDPNEFTSASLGQCAVNTYTVLNNYKDSLPIKFQNMLPYMEKQNWLVNYKSISGTEGSFGGLVRRTSYLNSSKEAFDLFLKHYDSLQICYSAFFPELKAFTISRIDKLTNK